MSDKIRTSEDFIPLSVEIVDLMIDMLSADARRSYMEGEISKLIASKMQALHPSESAGVKPPCFQIKANTGEIHQVKKYIIETNGSESVWCDTWYGHHRIGQDCEWVGAGVKGQEHYELAFIPCADDDPRSVGSYTSHDGQSLCYVRELHIPAAAQSEKRYPWGPDEYPDLSSCTPEQKHETIFGLIQLAAKEIMRMFYAFGLKTHIECKVVNEPTNETFEFSFVKVGAAAQSGKEEAVQPNKEDAETLLKWIKENGITRHSNGHWYKWQPDTSEKFFARDNEELYDIYKQQNKP